MATRGRAWAIDRARAVDDLIAAWDMGITTFDCADIYTGVEELVGEFRSQLANRRGADAAKLLTVHTKCVPDLDRLATLTRADIVAGIDRSLGRLRTERLDLVQLHWWDISVPGAVQAAVWLNDLREAGKIRQVGATNFDTPLLQAILNAGVPLLSMQVQYSVLDNRPEHGLSKLCLENGVSLLCYGSVAGGFLGERWLGVPEPIGALENRSLVKYKLIIDDFGGWDLFQHLLRVLAAIGARHGADIATVSSRYVLDQPAVSSVIVGARNAAHAASNGRICEVVLTPQDRAEIAAVLDQRQGPEGDIYTLERDRTGRHGSIMKYNLNTNPH